MKSLLRITSFVLLAMVVSSCEVIGDIFGAGVYTGIFLVVLVTGIIVFLILKMRKRD